MQLWHFDHFKTQYTYRGSGPPFALISGARSTHLVCYILLPIRDIFNTVK